MKSPQDKKGMTWTALICTTVVIALGIYDLAVVSFGRGDISLSISRYLESLRRFPVIVFTFGYIAGHVFGFMTPLSELKEPDPPAIVEPGAVGESK